MTAPRTLRGPAARVGSDLADLVLPVDCAGCGRPGTSLCRTCRAGFAEPWRCESEATVLAGMPGSTTQMLPTWASGTYAGAVRHFVLAWKSGVRPDLRAPAHDLGVGSGRGLAQQLHLPAPPAAAELDLLLVPAPSGWRRRITRRLVAADLARSVAEGLAEGATCRVWVADILRRRGGSTHRLSAAARTRSPGRGVRALAALPPGLPVLIVDDVVTTGATIQACRMRLNQCGARVVGAFALAATPPPGQPVPAVDGPRAGG